MARVTTLGFGDLAGWAEDDHAEALAAFRETCDLLAEDDLARAARDATDARAFFEARFQPVLIEDGAPMLFTGYYEPELAGSRVETPRFRVPLYALPPERAEGPWLDRAAIVAGALAGRGLEIAWVEAPLDAFLLQVQGSGRIVLPEGVLRVGYAGGNGHPYRSIGRALIERGALDETNASVQAIRDWAAMHPDEVAGLLSLNPSYVFFRELTDLPPDRGPLGAMGRSVTPGRSIAVDPAHVALGLPVWIEREGPTPMRRLMVAQDTGSAIKGAQRADIYCGTGAAAGAVAGALRDGGRMVVLRPNKAAP